jgi:hypothetical protein
VADIREVASARSVLGAELAKALRRHPAGPMHHDHVVENVMLDRLAPGGSLHGQQITEAQLAEHKRALSKALKTAARPRRRGNGAVTPAALSRFLAHPWAPGGVLLWQLPKGTNAEEVPDSGDE